MGFVGRGGVCRAKGGGSGSIAKVLGGEMLPFCVLVFVTSRANPGAVSAPSVIIYSELFASTTHGYFNLFRALSIDNATLKPHTSMP